ncbi:unnamed protein product [Symbiodinium sp. CCMP2592]|nr:unnamed protein product [Symbiodinium sp. CCMP2592]
MAARAMVNTAKKARQQEDRVQKMMAKVRDVNDRAVIHNVEQFLDKCDPGQLAHIRTLVETKVAGGSAPGEEQAVGEEDSLALESHQSKYNLLTVEHLKFLLREVSFPEHVLEMFRTKPVLIKLLGFVTHTDAKSALPGRSLPEVLEEVRSNLKPSRVETVDSVESVVYWTKEESFLRFIDHTDNLPLQVDLTEYQMEDWDLQEADSYTNGRLVDTSSNLGLKTRCEGECTLVSPEDDEQWLVAQRGQCQRGQCPRGPAEVAEEQSGSSRSSLAP